MDTVCTKGCDEETNDDICAGAVLMAGLRIHGSSSYKVAHLCEYHFRKVKWEDILFVGKCGAYHHTKEECEDLPSNLV